MTETNIFAEQYWDNCPIELDTECRELDLVMGN